MLVSRRVIRGEKKSDPFIDYLVLALDLHEDIIDRSKYARSITSKITPVFEDNSFVLDDNYLAAAHDPVFALTNKDFTIEGWVYITAVNQGLYIHRTNKATDTTTTMGPLMEFTSSVTGSNTNRAASMTLIRSGFPPIVGHDSVSVSGQVTTPSVGVWFHFAISRQGNLLKSFIDGIQRGNTVETTLSTNNINGGLYIGRRISYFSNNFTVSTSSGRLSDFRYYIGVAKYTENFTPPSRL
jgi:hypothetical protein